MGSYEDDLESTGYRPSEMGREERQALLPSSPKEQGQHVSEHFKPRSRCAALCSRPIVQIILSFIGGIAACLTIQFIACAIGHNSKGLASSLDRLASPSAGSTEVHRFPPSKPTNAFPSLFPTSVGHAGPTPTGAEPALIQTAPSYPLHTGAPHLVSPSFKSNNSSSSSQFDLFKHWGNLSPWFSVERGSFGLDSSPEAPKGCRVTGLHLLHRHGARYPTGYGNVVPRYCLIIVLIFSDSLVWWTCQLLIPLA